MNVDTILKFVGREVFVFGSNIEDEVPKELKVTTVFNEMQRHLHNEDARLSSGALLLHGVLTSAVSIPNDVPKGTYIYIILPEANHAGDSFIIAVESVDHLTAIIEAAVNPVIAPTSSAETLDYLFDVDIQNIEDVFVLYGYEVDLVYHTNIDSIYPKELAGPKDTASKIKNYQK